MPGASASDLERLDQALPSNVSGLSFAQPEFVSASQGKVRVHSVSSPQHVARHLGVLGDRLLDASQAFAALNFYDLALRIGHEPSLLIKRAEALFHLGRMEEAQRELFSALEIEPKNAEALFWMGRVALHRERHEEAVRYFSRVQKVTSHTPDWQEVARTYLQFASIYQERDQLHLRNLKPRDYVLEIEKLRTKAQDLRQEVCSARQAHLQGMALHLDALENLFSSWLRELQSNSYQT